MACSTILNEKTGLSRPPFWTINPYRGCQFGCPFCYARLAHGQLDETDPKAFSSRIYVKFQAPQVLAETLNPAKLRGRQIVIGTATDPYQPAEKRFRITQRILQVLSKYPDLDLSITTRSPLIVRDIKLLQRISKSSRLSVNVSMITMNSSLSRIIEGSTPSPQRRLETIRALSEAGIETGVFVMPILPGITDNPMEIKTLLQACRNEGASYAAGEVARIFGSSWEVFRPILADYYPHLIATYQEIATRKGRFSNEVVRTVKSGFHSARESVGLAASAGPDPRRETDPSGWSGSLFEGLEEAESGPLTYDKKTRSA